MVPIWFSCYGGDRAKNRIEASSGTKWLDLWLSTKQPPANVVLFRARLELPDRKAAIRFIDRFRDISSDLDIRSQVARWHGLEGDNDRALAILRGVIEEDRSRHQDLLTLGLLETRPIIWTQQKRDSNRY